MALDLLLPEPEIATYMVSSLLEILSVHESARAWEINHHSLKMLAPIRAWHLAFLFNMTLITEVILSN